MTKNIIIKAGVLGVFAVLGGAFGAHALKVVLTTEQLASFDTGIRYQMIHAVVLLLLFVLLEKYKVKQFKIASAFIFWGVVLFSGSIYLLTLKNIIWADWLKFAGPITPIGGLLIITGWVFIVLGGFKLRD